MLILVKNNCHIIALFIIISGALIAARHINSKHICSSTSANLPHITCTHSDKIVFFIKSPILAGDLHLVPETEYDIKVLDDPHKVADIKQKVLDFLKYQMNPEIRLTYT